MTSTTSGQASTRGVRKSRSGNLFVSTVKLLRRIEVSTSQLNFCFQGRAECELNKLHGCILEHLAFEQAFQIISCLMNSLRSDINDVSAFLVLSCCRCSAATSQNSISHWKFRKFTQLSAIHNNLIWRRRGAATMAPTRHRESSYWKLMEIRRAKSIWALCQASRLTMWVSLCIMSLNRKSSLKSRKSFRQDFESKTFVSHLSVKAFFT